MVIIFTRSDCDDEILAPKLGTCSHKKREVECPAQMDFAFRSNTGERRFGLSSGMTASV
jgi:hypothetical protein